MRDTTTTTVETALRGIERTEPGALLNDVPQMTLWGAYRLANRRRAAVSVDLGPDAGLGNGRTERSLRVSPNLTNGHVTVKQGTTADLTFVPSAMAKTVMVTRDTESRAQGW